MAWETPAASNAAGEGSSSNSGSERNMLTSKNLGRQAGKMDFCLDVFTSRLQLEGSTHSGVRV